MSLLARKRALILFGLAALLVLSGRRSSGEEPAGQVSSSGSAFSAPSNAPPLGLGLGHASNAEVLERIADRSEGHVPVDPFALHPPALSPDANNGFEWHASKPYTCWVVEGGTAQLRARHCGGVLRGGDTCRWLRQWRWKPGR
jgi:hypothetical protein